MFIIKNNYYLYIENTRSLNLDYIKKNNKISIIYRNNGIQENVEHLRRFRNECKNKNFKFFVANNFKLAEFIKADGVYLSSYDRKIYPKYKYNLIGSAHSFNEIYLKKKQGCKTVILSRLFKTSYEDKKGYLGIVRFNLIQNNCLVDLVPLGGINNTNLLKLNLVISKGFCLLSEIKKKPAISNRLF